MQRRRDEYRTIRFNDGNPGERIKVVQNDDETLSNVEEEFLSQMIKLFQNSNARQIADISYDEPA